MEAGRLNERITLLRFVPEKSDTNQKKKGSYAPAFKVWAEVKCTQSTVTLDSGVIVYETVYRFNVRKRNDIDASMRIAWAGHEFYMTGEPVDWKTIRGGMTLLAKEVT
jgi:head-tail adaptor